MYEKVIEKNKNLSGISSVNFIICNCILRRPVETGCGWLLVVGRHWQLSNECMVLAGWQSGWNFRMLLF